MGGLRSARAAFAAALLLFVAGCQHLNPGPRITLVPGSAVLLMPVDVEVSEIPASGIAVPKADWTEAARRHVAAALAEEKASRGATLVDFAPAAPESELRQTQDEAGALHEVVRTSAMVYRSWGLRQPSPLSLAAQPLRPSTIGPEAAKALRNDHTARYALFVYMRDGHATASRIASQVALRIVAAAFGVISYGPMGGVQTGVVSLVDLNTGDIVWINILVSPTGDLREPTPARDAIRILLKDLPS
jgi:hypothetical protein